MYFVHIALNAVDTFLTYLAVKKSYLDPKCVRKFKFCVSALVKRYPGLFKPNISAWRVFATT